jgi:hypothetical protein
MTATSVRFWCLAAVVVATSTLSTHAQHIDIYQQAANLYKEAAAKVPFAQGQCYLQLAKYHDCLAGGLLGAASSCGNPSTNCSVVPTAGVGSLGGLATSAASRATNSAAAAASRAEDIQQAVNVGFTVFRGIMAFRKQRQAQREAQQRQQQLQRQNSPVQGGDPQAEAEAQRMQAMAQMLARQRALLEEAADKLLADGQGLLDSADKLFANADALLGRSSTGGGVEPTGAPAGSSRSASTGSPSGDTSSSAKSTTNSAHSGSSAQASTTGVNGDSCATGWADETFRVTQFGNDQLWENSGALAFITNEAGQATAFGKFLSLQYATGHQTHMQFGLAGRLDNDLAPGDSRRLAIDRAGLGTPSVDIRVRYCKE